MSNPPLRLMTEAEVAAWILLSVKYLQEGRKLTRRARAAGARGARHDELSERAETYMRASDFLSKVEETDSLVETARTLSTIFRGLPTPTRPKS